MTEWKVLGLKYRSYPKIYFTIGLLRQARLFEAEIDFIVLGSERKWT
jgi:hypothetical protein